MIADLYFSLQFAAIWDFTAKDSNTLRLKKTKTETEKQKQEVCVHTTLSGPSREGYSLFLGTGLYGGPFLP